MGARPSPRHLKISFEVHVQRTGGWAVEEVFLEQDDALAFADRLRQRLDLGGVRVIREAYDPERDDAVERVVFDTALGTPQRPPAAPGPASGRPPHAPAESGSTRPRRDRPHKYPPFS